jgi:hypothetical protein
MPSKLDICNDALAELPSASIASLDEPSVEAHECTRAYPSALQTMLEMHPWSFANTRVAVAATANDRPVEWPFAYALPSNCATPLKIIPDYSGVGVPQNYAYYGLWGEWERRGFPWDIGLGRFYDVEGATLYSWVENATLEYVSRDLAEARMTALFARALVLELASRIVMPIKKSRELKGDLIKQAEVAKGRAMAADANRQLQESAPYESEASRARTGCYGLSY